MNLVFVPQAEAQKRAIVAWAMARLPVGFDLGLAEPLAVMDGDRIRAAAIFTAKRFLPFGRSLEVSFVSSGPGWANRGVLRALFHYPFVQQDCGRLTAFVARGNQRARKLLESLGFTLEGSHPLAYDGRQAALTYGMKRSSCPWLEPHGQAITTTSIAA